MGTKVRHRDFDAAWAERERPSVKVFGQHHLLPASVPAELILQLAAIGADDRDPEDIAEMGDLMAVLSTIFGKATVEGWISEHQMDLDQMSDLFIYCMETWAGEDDEDEDDEGNAETQPTTER